MEARVLVREVRTGVLSPVEAEQSMQKAKLLSPIALGESKQDMLIYDDDDDDEGEEEEDEGEEEYEDQEGDEEELVGFAAVSMASFRLDSVLYAPQQHNLPV